MYIIEVVLRRGPKTVVMYPSAPRSKKAHGWAGFGFQFNLHTEKLYALKLELEEEAEEIADLTDLMLTYSINDPDIEWQIEVINV